MYCNSCESNPCSCTKRAVATSLWIYQHCVTEGCHTSIRRRAGQQQQRPLCKWCRGVEAASRLGVIEDQAAHPKDVTRLLTSLSHGKAM